MVNKLFIFLSLLFTSFYSEAQFVNTLSCSNNTSGSNWTIIGSPSAVNGSVITANTVGANFVAVAVSNYAVSPTLSATGGMSFSVAKSVNYTAVYTTIFYAFPTAGQTSSSTTFTLTAGTYASLAVLCAYNPVIPTLDQTAGTGSGSSLTSSSITPSYTYELILNALSFDNASGYTWSAATGWTGLYASGTSSNFGLGFEYYIYSGSSSINAVTTGIQHSVFGNIIASWAQ
jgi:hypothetical protein